MYVLDEPTTGLHFEDTRKLIAVLSKLVDQGNTVVVIEHNLDVIRTSDWVIDLGPEGGSRGGQIIATGTPEQVAATPGSHTGQFLADVLKGTDIPVGEASLVPVPPPLRGAKGAARNGSATTTTTARSTTKKAAKAPTKRTTSRAAGKS